MAVEPPPQRMAFAAEPVRYVVQQDRASLTLNALRKQNGLAPLRRLPALDRLARQHAAYLHAGNPFGHRDARGRNAWARVQMAGYGPRLVAENISWGTGSFGQTLALWQARPDHRINQMHPRARDFGLASVGTGAQRYWVLIVAAR